METLIVERVEDLPDWLTSHQVDLATEYLDDGYHIVIARRGDGESQVIPDGDLDTSVIADLMCWAVGG